tara:strand:+ start:9381 stop:11636 length:2256 start_codon:yes stop_codon:yes gene_type:complete
MAIKKYERSQKFLNEIGIARGEGRSFAAAEVKQDANSFDNLVETLSQNELTRLQEQGKKLGLEAAQDTTFVYKTLESGVEIPVLPKVPDYLGKTGQDTFEKQIYKLYEFQGKKDISAKIKEFAVRAKIDGRTPEEFRNQSIDYLDNIFEAYEPKFKTVMQIHAGAELNRFEYDVINSYEKKRAIDNTNSLNDIEFSNYNEQSRNIIMTGASDSNLSKEYKEAVMNLSPKIREAKLKDIADYDLYLESLTFIRNRFPEELINDDKNRNINKAQKIKALMQAIENGIIQPGDTFFSKEEKRKFFSDPSVNKRILNVLKNRKKYISAETSAVINNQNLQTYMTDFRLNKDDESWSYNMSKLSDQKLDTLFRDKSTSEEIFNEYSRLRKDDPFIGTYEEYTLRAFGRLPTEANDLVRNALNNNVISERSLESILNIKQYFDERGTNTKLRGLNLRDVRKIFRINAAYEMSFDETGKFNFEKFTQMHNDIKSKESIMNLAKRVGYIDDQTYESGNQYVASLANAAVKDSNLASFPDTLVLDIQGFLSNQIMIKDLVLKDNTTKRADLIKLAKQAMPYFLDNATGDESRIQLSNFSRAMIPITGDGQNHAVAMPIDRVYSIKRSDLEAYDLTGTPYENYFNQGFDGENSNYIKKYIENKVRGNNGSVYMTGTGNTERVTGTLGKDYFAIPMYVYNTDENIMLYQISVFDDSSDEFTVDRYVEVNDNNGSEIVITGEELLDIKRQEIQRIKEELENAD